MWAASSVGFLFIWCLLACATGQPIENGKVQMSTMRSSGDIWSWLNPFAWMRTSYNNKDTTIIVNQRTSILSANVTSTSVNWKGNLTVQCNADTCTIVHCYTGQCLILECFLPFTKTSPDCLNYGFLVMTAFPDKVYSVISTATTQVEPQMQICEDTSISLSTRIHDSLSSIYNSFLKYPFTWMGLIEDNKQTVSTAHPMTKTNWNGNLTVQCNEYDCKILNCCNGKCKGSTCYMDSAKTSQDCLIYSIVVLSTFAPPNELIFSSTNPSIDMSSATIPSQKISTSAPSLQATVQSLSLTNSELDKIAEVPVLVDQLRPPTSVSKLTGLPGEVSEETIVVSSSKATSTTVSPKMSTVTSATLLTESLKVYEITEKYFPAAPQSATITALASMSFENTLPEKTSPYVEHLTFQTPYQLMSSAEHRVTLSPDQPNSGIEDSSLPLSFTLKSSADYTSQKPILQTENSIHDRPNLSTENPFLLKSDQSSLTAELTTLMTPNSSISSTEHLSALNDLRPSTGRGPVPTVYRT